MISSISSYSSSSYVSSSTNNSSKQNSLSSSQLDTIESTLSSFDADSLSSEDAMQIVDAFKSAGIRPSEELASAMDSFGFNAKEVGDLAGVSKGDMPPPPPPPKDEEIDTVSSLLETLFESEEDDETSSDSSFESIMDYTSRILNLNEKSKSELMNFFENYEKGNSELSKEDVSKVVKNQLSQVLNDPNNYNHTSYYA